ncbi:Hypothetical predicted protein [Marmota monax]|uniref:Uncharacterized protein n=1 Tax=Marmota monax TaxID=9995 RepID=A0A5E4CC27_MARMO|nr:hypothetical protein GHT09_002361 [Marmota monax]VTJ79295.1 Hypothetical predicted protein [Marmota monax]
MLTTAGSAKVQYGPGQSSSQSVGNLGDDKVWKDYDVEKDESQNEWALVEGCGKLVDTGPM